MLLPLLAFLAFVWFERSYLLIVYYDFTNQLESQHRLVNLVWCAWLGGFAPRALETRHAAPEPRMRSLGPWHRHITSPSMPLALWVYCFNPRIFTDLPGWPGILSVVLTTAVSNGLLLYYFHRHTQEYIGSVSCQLTATAVAMCPCENDPASAPVLWMRKRRKTPAAQESPVWRRAQVRWLHGVWLVWRKPQDAAPKGKVS